MARPIVLIPHLYRLADAINFRKDYSPPPLVRHLDPFKGPEGVARQAALKEAADAKKRKRAEKAQRKHQKEQDIAPRVRAGENTSDVEAELETLVAAGVLPDHVTSGWWLASGEPFPMPNYRVEMAD